MTLQDCHTGISTIKRRAPSSPTIFSNDHAIKQVFQHYTNTGQGVVLVYNMNLRQFSHH
jgi:hypothetical protein